jgi:hypothetical protein
MDQPNQVWKIYKPIEIIIKKKSQSRNPNIFISNDKVEKMINLKNDQKTPNKLIFMI